MITPLSFIFDGEEMKRLFTRLRQYKSFLIGTDSYPTDYDMQLVDSLENSHIQKPNRLEKSLNEGWGPKTVEEYIDDWPKDEP